MVIDYSEALNLKTCMLITYTQMILNDIYSDITIDAINIVNNEIVVNYTIKKEYEGSDPKYVSDVYNISIMDYISFVHIYTIKKIEILYL
jgi:hypothetical protein